MPTWVEHFQRPRARRGAGEAAMQQQDLADLLLDRVQRIERCHRLLEDDGDVVAAHAPHLAFREPQKLAAVERDGARRMTRRRIGQELEDRQRRYRLAGAGFADQRHGLALADIERDAIDGQRLRSAIAVAKATERSRMERRGSVM